MTKGAVHPNGSNFRRVARLDVVARVRRLCESKLLAERPKWLEWCERVPPLENHNLKLQARTVRNPYPQMVGHLLKKYPDLRFQDCYVDGNDWSAGNDAYRDDHPAMQFVARQLDFMRTEGLSKQAAFLRTEELFRERRQHLEREQKVMMAMAMDSGVSPMFTTGKAYLQAERAKAEAAHLNIIRRRLRELKHNAIERQKEEEDREKPRTFKERRWAEQASAEQADEGRQGLVGEVAEDEVPEDTVKAAAESEEETEVPESRPLTEEEEEAGEARATAAGSESLEDAGLKKLATPPSDEAPRAAPKTARPPPDPERRDPVEDILVTPRKKTTAAMGAMLGQDRPKVMGEDADGDDDFGMGGSASKRAEKLSDRSRGLRGSFGDEDEKAGGRRGGGGRGER